MGGWGCVRPGLVARTPGGSDTPKEYGAGGGFVVIGCPASGVGGVPETDGRPRCDCLEQLIKKQRLKKKKKRKKASRGFPVPLLLFKQRNNLFF